MSDPATFAPRSETQVVDAIQAAREAGEALSIRGGNTRSGLGRPDRAAATLDLSGLSGITLYEPAELVMSARAGTPVAEIEAALAERGQMLPFEPLDHRGIYKSTGQPTIGGVFATNASGSRRLSVGAARDYCLGVRFVNGRGETIANGGRVMKNVTGLDLVKLSCGAMGTLGVLTEVTFKVLPAPRHAVTLAFRNLRPDQAIATMTRATGSPYDVAAAAHRQGRNGHGALTALRLEGFEESTTYRARSLAALLAEYGVGTELTSDAAALFWSGLSRPEGEEDGRELWRLVLPAGKAHATLAPLLERDDLAVTFDWAGGLAWIAAPPATLHPAEVFRLAADARGTATLVRAADTRRNDHVFQPLAAPAFALAQRIKQAVDPDRLLNPGRLYRDL